MESDYFCPNTVKSCKVSQSKNPKLEIFITVFELNHRWVKRLGTQILYRFTVNPYEFKLMVLIRKHRMNPVKSFLVQIWSMKSVKDLKLHVFQK